MNTVAGALSERPRAIGNRPYEACSQQQPHYKIRIRKPYFTFTCFAFDHADQ